MKNKIKVKIHKTKNSKNKNLIGFAGIIYNGIALNNIAIFRNGEEYNLVFPAKKLKTGDYANYYYPIDKEIKAEIIASVINELKLTEGKEFIA